MKARNIEDEAQGSLPLLLTEKREERKRDPRLAAGWLHSEGPGAAHGAASVPNHRALHAVKQLKCGEKEENVLFYFLNPWTDQGARGLTLLLLLLLLCVEGSSLGIVGMMMMVMTERRMEVVMMMSELLAGANGRLSAGSPRIVSPSAQCEAKPITRHNAGYGEAL
ncbi:unnamed protein product [Pleuronectes platessa]|uniref:Uncharacterized protein n=1 Tax=Pleuronectes platessa TaxID=8262 RepID=A0A9N7V8J3_PLEPL|nr:unnamed protein product [Pleuronectes platessa]